MTKREDGKETRKRLLKTACEVFAENPVCGSLQAE